MNYVKTNIDRMFYIEALVNTSVAYFHKGSKTSYEKHDFWEILYVTRSSISVISDSNPLIVNSGEAIFHKPFERHQHCGITNDNGHGLVFSFVCNSDAMKFFENKVIKISRANGLLLEKVLETVYLNGTRRNIATPQSELNKASLYLETFLLQTYIESNNSSSVSYHMQQSYNQIIIFLKLNINKKFSLSEIAQHCNMSVSNMKKIFHYFSDDGIMTFFNRLKIDEAKRFLVLDFTISDISDMLAFSSQNYFTVCFKRETGMPPLKYKQQYKKEIGTSAQPEKILAQLPTKDLYM